jgi:hypothetical protein
MTDRIAEAVLTAIFGALMFTVLYFFLKGAFDYTVSDFGLGVWFGIVFSTVYDILKGNYERRR